MSTVPYVAKYRLYYVTGRPRAVQHKGYLILCTLPRTTSTHLKYCTLRTFFFFFTIINTLKLYLCQKMLSFWSVQGKFYCILPSFRVLSYPGRSVNESNISPVQCIEGLLASLGIAFKWSLFRVHSDMDFQTV